MMPLTKGLKMSMSGAGQMPKTIVGTRSGIIAQSSVTVLPEDTEESLHRRIQREEHRLFPEVVKAFANGRLRIEGRSVVWEGVVP